MGKPAAHTPWFGQPSHADALPASSLCVPGQSGEMQQAHCVTKQTEHPILCSYHEEPPVAYLPHSSLRAPHTPLHRLPQLTVRQLDHVRGGIFVVLHIHCVRTYVYTHKRTRARRHAYAHTRGGLNNEGDALSATKPTEPLHAMESLSRQPDLERLLYQSSKPGGLETVQQQSATAATVLTLEGKADAPAASSEREEVQIKLVDKLQMVRSPVEAAAAVGSELDATSQLAAAEEAGAGALDIAQRRALLLGRTKQRHVCLQCGRECPSKHKLKRHLSTHSEQRPYNCHLCGKTFKWTEYLAKHMRTQHPGAEG